MREPIRSLPSPECVVKVGGGRGFIVEHSAKPSKGSKFRPRKFRPRRVIITAAHCLPD
jgi:hypothetical protein